MPGTRKPRCPRHLMVDITLPVGYVHVGVGHGNSWGGRQGLLWIVYMVVMGLLVACAVALAEPFQPHVLFFLGALALWRYGWGLVHLIRAWVYCRIVFPRWRRRSEAAVAGGRAWTAPELFIVVTSYRIMAETTAVVIRAAVAEAERFQGPATIVVSLVEPADERFIKALFVKLSPSELVRLRFVRLDDQGKREALAVALRAVARAMPSPDAVIVVMDGNTVLTPESVLRCLPLLAAMPDIAALTTDSEAMTHGRSALRAWYRLRLAKRQMLQSSLALGRHLPALSGRMSIFRANLATDPGLIARIESDGLDHWRLGQIRLRTGADWSIWLWLLERGGGMLHVPDVQVLTIEDPPGRSFIKSTTWVMRRWSGDMLRARVRAVALGPTHLGFFTWWTLVDQRLSIWTPMAGPIAIGLLAATESSFFLPAYFAWVTLSRLLQTLCLLSVRPRVHPAWPILLYFHQLQSAWIKSWALFRLDREQWIGQGSAVGRAGSFWRAASSIYIQGLALATLVVAIALFTGNLAWPDLVTASHLF